MSDEKILELIKNEREFLHDISTPLMIASGHLEYLVNQGTEGGDPEKTRYRMEKAYASMVKLTDKLQERREALKALIGELKS